MLLNKTRRHSHSTALYSILLSSTCLIKSLLSSTLPLQY